MNEGSLLKIPAIAGEMENEKMAELKNFEKNMARLEEIVKLLEKGEVPLEKSLALFEEGTALVGKCSAVLNQAERKIRKLSTGEEEPNIEELNFFDDAPADV